MRPSVALEKHRETIRSLVQDFRTVNPRVLGSVSRGEDGNDSDIDLMVDALPGATLLDLGGLQVELERLLGVPVDLLTPEDVPLRFRAQVLADARPL